MAVANMTISEEMPVQGGGLGAKKVGIFIIGGKYDKGGVAFDLPEPVFMMASGGFGAEYDSVGKKVKLTYLKDSPEADGAVTATEIKAGTVLKDIKLFYVTNAMF